MTIARDEWNWRDVGGPGNLHIEELSQAEREKADAKRAAKLKEDYAKSVESRREQEERTEAMLHGGAADQRAIDILTPLSVHRKHDAELAAARRVYDATKQWEREDAQREPEYEGGPTPEETAKLEAWLDEEDDDEDDSTFWHDE